jgi:hypothetical protein
MARVTRTMTTAPVTYDRKGRTMTQTVDLVTTRAVVGPGVAAIRAMLEGHYIRSAELLSGQPGWVRLTFDDDATLDVPAVCLELTSPEPSAEIAGVPRPRRPLY